MNDCWSETRKHLDFMLVLDEGRPCITNKPDEPFRPKPSRLLPLFPPPSTVGQAEIVGRNSSRVQILGKRK
jgi:hypothetical protein